MSIFTLGPIEKADLLQAVADDQVGLRVAAVFQRAFDGLPSGKERTGCFVCNAMVELAPSDPEVAELTSRIFERIQDTMCEALKSLPALKSKSSQEIRHKAALLANLYFGAQAVSKTGLAMPPWNELIQAILAQHERT